MKKVFVTIISVLIFLLLLVFALNNLGSVTLNFVGGIQWEMRMIVLILAIFAAGCFIGMLAMLPFAFKRRRKNKEKIQAAATTTTEIIPVK